MGIRHSNRDDFPEWLRLRLLLWPHCAREEHVAEMEKWNADVETSANFVFEIEQGKLGGFVEVSIRDHVEGRATSPVGFLEGWYVEPELRRQGWGRRLAEAAEQWALERGCREMGSDTEIDREVSIRAHLAMEYEEVERVVRFKKTLSLPPPPLELGGGY